ncbi:MAG: preprotein translocase subunit SecA [Oscillospiraceae bacterium]|nr:preprotein translocase subunit SecA [Oscillospiraceae bacterium]
MSNSFGIKFSEIRKLAKCGLHELLTQMESKPNAERAMTLGLAACCNAAESALGLVAFDEQLIAAAALHSNRIVEMKTGEGKTLSAVFAAFLLKREGRKVHIFTFNDYLAKRDYNWMKPIYSLLGVNLALITESTPFEERKAAYNNADVIYSTVKECGFDFLRDFMVFDSESAVGKIDSSAEFSESNQKSPRFDFAIFDEADSVLIDEARIPLVIAGDVDAAVSVEFMKAFEFAKGLADDDYGINHETMGVFLTDNGVHKTEEHFKTENLYDEGNIDLRCNIDTCMKALFYLKENRDYVVKGGRVQLIDALTGRIAQHRLLPGPLQAAVEAKHGLGVTERGVVTGVIPIQFFARQYKEIAGMTGTASASAEEFALLYGLEVEAIRPHKPSKRIDNPGTVYYDSESKWKAITDKIVSVHKKGQPVLIGTSSIEESEHLAEMLVQAGIKTASVLNAKNDEMEAEIIKNAGALGAITVSTNMAGRGIDIKLGGFDESSRDEVVKAGGLYIIGTALYENARMNEQLNGRAGRQGDVGQTSLFIALDDDIMLKYDIKKALKRHYPKPTPDVITSKKVTKEIERTQRIAQDSLLQERKRLLRFTMIGEKHRDIIFQKRLEYLNGERTPDIWQNYAQEEYSRLARKCGNDAEKLQSVQKEIILSAINEIWCDYLEYTSELRTGIHLRAVAGRNPAEEYNIDSELYFEGAEERLVGKVCDYLELLSDSEDLTAKPIQLFKPKNARTFLMEESGDELVRKPILLNVFSDENEEEA